MTDLNNAFAHRVIAALTRLPKDEKGISVFINEDLDDPVEQAAFLNKSDLIKRAPSRMRWQSSLDHESDADTFVILADAEAVEDTILVETMFDSSAPQYFASQDLSLFFAEAIRSTDISEEITISNLEFVLAFEDDNEPGSLYTVTSKTINDRDDLVYLSDFIISKHAGLSPLAIEDEVAEAAAYALNLNMNKANYANISCLTNRRLNMTKVCAKLPKYFDMKSLFLFNTLLTVEPQLDFTGFPPNLKSVDLSFGDDVRETALKFTTDKGQDTVYYIDLMTDEAHYDSVTAYSKNWMAGLVTYFEKQRLLTGENTFTVDNPGYLAPPRQSNGQPTLG